MNDIAWFLDRVPETVDTGTLVTYVIHLQRIIGAVGADSSVGPNAAENIPHIPAHGIHFLPLPGSHTSPFQKHSRNIAGTCRIIIGAACTHI